MYELDEEIKGKLIAEYIKIFENEIYEGGYSEGIKNTLDIIGIKIKGIND